MRLTPKNCLATAKPNLAAEWCYHKNQGLTPNDVTHGSRKKVWWKCTEGHEWESSINNRFNGNGCPYCSGTFVTKKTCLASVNPRLAAEWHPIKNLHLTPDDVTEHSGKNVWWRCTKGHEWKASINNRSWGTGCPYCFGKLACASNCLTRTHPRLALEWHSTKNGKLTCDNVTFGMTKKVWWYCSKGHEWRAAINSRSSGNGCPYCSGKKACFDTCLLTVSPTIASEWHPTKNGALKPTDVTAYSNKKVWWLCDKGHEWQSAVYNRAKGNGCPYCSGRKVYEGNCLATINPELVAEWHPSRNFKLTPNDVTAFSNKKVWWKCGEGHDWYAVVGSRARGNGCPKCAGGPVSKVSQEWLDSLGIPEEFREHPIRLPGRKRPIHVDGFDPATNTVYEFLGDYWHGNPNLYDSKGVNSHNKKTFGALYNQTLLRLERLRKAGYTVVFIWEKDFKPESEGSF